MPIDQPATRSWPDPTDWLAGISAAEPSAADRFVGRRAELTALRLGLDALTKSQGNLFLISGEPGIGKSRLATELTNQARRRGVPVHWGRCWESSGAPSYWPWIEMIRLVLAGDASLDRAELGRHAQFLATLDLDLAVRLGTAHAAALEPSDPESARFLLFDAVAALLRRAAERQPMMLVIDDLHAADRGSALLLAFLARTLAESAILFVATYREAEIGLEETLVQPLAELARRARRLPLRGLAAEDVGVLIEAVTGSTPVSWVVQDVNRVTEGNPFFVCELARLLAADGLIAAGEPAPVRIPDGVRDAVRRRLEPIADEGIELLEVAATIGRSFDATVVGLATGLDAIEVADALEEPIRHGLVEQIDGGQFSFRHGLIRDVVYAGLSPAQRLRSHHRVAEALETASARVPDRYVAQLAHHFLAAASHADDRLVRYGMAAALHAQRRMALEEAVRLYQQVLDALPRLAPDERRRGEILLALAEAKDWSSDEAGARAAAKQAAEIGRQLDAPDLLARAALSVGAVTALKITATSRSHGARDLLCEALTALPEHEPRLRALIRCRLALLSLSGNLIEALELSARAVADARRSNDRGAMAHSLIARHAVLLGPDHMEERCAIADEILSIATELGSREFEMRGHALRMTNAFDLGDTRAADHAIDRHRRLADETGDPFERWVSLMWHSTRAAFAGRFDEAESRSREAYDLARTVSGPHAYDLNAPMCFTAQTILLQEARWAGSPDPQVIAHYRDRYPEVAAWRVGMLYQLTRLGRVREVRDELDALASSDFAAIERNATWLGAMVNVSEAVNLVGDQVRAATLYDLLLPYANRNATVSLLISRGSVSRPLGLLAATLGRIEDAARHYDDALAMHRRMGARPHTALTLYEYGRMLAGVPAEHARAPALLREAICLARELGMEGLVERCVAAFEGRPFQHDDSSTPVIERNAEEFELRKEGPFWKLRRHDKQVTLKDRKGLAFIAELIRQPERDVHVLNLLALVEGSVRDDLGRIRDADDATTPRSSFADEMLDQRARRSYLRRASELQEQIAEREVAGDPQQIFELRQELGLVERELARVTGLGGRVRRISDVERARVNVRRTIRLALAHVVEVAPEMGRTLACSIRTGTFCRYSPPHPSIQTLGTED